MIYNYKFKETDNYLILFIINSKFCKVSYGCN